MPSLVMTKRKNKHLRSLLTEEKHMSPGFKSRFAKKKKDEVHPEVLFQKTLRIKRTCLLCGATFDSEGPANRRCKVCSRNLSNKPVPPETFRTPASFDED